MTTSIRDKKIDGMKKIKDAYMKAKEEGTIITYMITLDENGKYIKLDNIKENDNGKI